jgi:hypothetical protein
MSVTYHVVMPFSMDDDGNLPPLEAQKRRTPMPLSAGLGVLSRIHHGLERPVLRPDVNRSFVAFVHCGTD